MVILGAGAEPLPVQGIQPWFLLVRSLLNLGVAEMLHTFPHPTCSIKDYHSGPQGLFWLMSCSCFEGVKGSTSIGPGLKLCRVHRN